MHKSVISLDWKSANVPIEDPSTRPVRTGMCISNVKVILHVGKNCQIQLP